ncbi:hypothetical protein B0H19DRAFT_1166734 [Mycena capillaripes]|nr:hypothetical protein B0H19DRAFT_1166734 [Mycena capillaripes]
MAPSGKYIRIPHNFSRESLPLPRPSSTPSLHPNRLVRKFREAIPTPTPLTREQIEYLVAKASAKTQQKNELGLSQPWTAVPNPVPDTGIHPTAVHRVKSSSSSVASSPSVSPSQSLFSNLAPFSIAPTQAPNLVSPKPVIIITSTAASLAPTTTAAIHNNVSTPSPPPRLPTAAISLIAVAGACLLLALFVTIKICVRPTRRPRPVPSRPILDDPFPDDGEFHDKLEDSPVFGGKERLSEHPGNSGLWNWTQYPTPATTTAAASTIYDGSNTQLGRSDTHGKMSYAGRNEKSAYHFTDPLHSIGVTSTQTPANSPYPAPMYQVVHSSLTRAASRLSTASASMYPATPSSNHNYGQLVTSFTADGYPVMERVSPKVLQRSRSSTVGERNHRERPQTRANRHSCGFAYDGAEVKSPTIPIAPAVPGRTRIKSSYYAHPRISTMPSSQSTKVRDENATSLHHKSESRTRRDTTMGFGSPATVYPSSPQPTVYPDDSLSVVEAKRAHHSIHKKPAQNNRRSRVFGRGDEDGLPPTSPTVDATAALGNLMLMDFSGTGESAANIASASSATLAPKKMMSRSDDKPPRVPSPPPLPSLAQMALEHANPEAYAEYRSPTYSIYGLYEGDTKSRVGI